jgi:small subunit ribosomal protein S7
MPRRGTVTRREVLPDPVYNSKLVTQVINKVLLDGKKSTAEQIVYGALEIVREKSGRDPVEVLQESIQALTPHLEVRSRRVGGATYQVPVEISFERQESLALRWIVTAAGTRKGVPMRDALAAEIIDAYNNTGTVVKKKEDTHKMAQANRAFAHLRW